jgi:alpha-mannosidase/mannosylglycerate hydrolase
MERTAYYVASTHWDREWYEPLQGFRMRLVSMLDEVFDTLDRDPDFKVFTMDGQTIPLFDYLEIRPEMRGKIEAYAREGRLKIGPWYVLPDEWLVSGESIVRNLQLGTKWAEELGGGAAASVAGFACDLFGHVGQLPQIFAQVGVKGAIVWRGTYEKEHHGNLIWQSPDGTELSTHRFGQIGYCTLAFKVRSCHEKDKTLSVDEMVEKMVDYVQYEMKRTEEGPVLLFDGGDHIEIEPRMSEVIARANVGLKEKGIGCRIVHSDLDTFCAELGKVKGRLNRKLSGELRETGRDPHTEDEQWLIPGVYSSRIHLKQRNAACEDELCLWAEPFSAFAARELGAEYPTGFLRTAWRYLLDNHPHDSICGCSPDPVHQDMIYRFDQSMGISERLARNAMRAITAAAAPKERSDGALVVGVFNATAEDVDEPVDLEIRLPTSWPKKFQEFFGFEEKFAFRLKDANGKEVPYQLVGQERNRMGFRVPRYKFPEGDARHVCAVTARVKVPAFGYTTLVVEPGDGPTRHLGSMVTSHRSVENEFLKVDVQAGGAVQVTDKRTGRVWKDLLTFEERADIGDGWYHGVAVNDQVYTSAACGADVAVVADGIGKATLRVTVTMNVPKEFNFRDMRRSDETARLKIVSDVTLRKGSDRIEVTTTVDNNVLDHRVRVLLPTGLKGETYLSDSAFDVVERKVALAADNAVRKELDVETRAQLTWTAFGDGKDGLAVVSRGLPETAVMDQPERTIALTLFRSFRRAVLSNDNLGGEIVGKHVFRYDVVPFKGEAPRKRLSLLGQRVNGPVKQVDLLPVELGQAKVEKVLPRENSFLRVEGEVVVTSVQREGEALQVRAFNPSGKGTMVKVTPGFKPSQATALILNGQADPVTKVRLVGASAEVELRAKRIATIAVT